LQTCFNEDTKLHLCILIMVIYLYALGINFVINKKYFILSIVMVECRSKWHHSIHRYSKSKIIFSLVNYNVWLVQMSTSIVLPFHVKCWRLFEPVLRCADARLYFPVPSMNRLLNSNRASFGLSLGILFLSIFSFYYIFYLIIFFMFAWEVTYF
jgi:hypothetical protein